MHKKGGHLDCGLDCRCSASRAEAFHNNKKANEARAAGLETTPLAKPPFFSNALDHSATNSTDPHTNHTCDSTA
eukprot:scaffold10707_cov70-Phaeocystis_antarctica.AAC.1